MQRQHDPKWPSLQRSRNQNPERQPGDNKLIHIDIEPGPRVFGQGRIRVPPNLETGVQEKGRYENPKPLQVNGRMKLACIQPERGSEVLPVEVRG